MLRRTGALLASFLLILAACGGGSQSTGTGGHSAGTGGHTAGTGGHTTGTGGTSTGTGGTSTGTGGGAAASCTPATSWALGFTPLREIAVSPTGNDGTGDGSAQKPFASIAGALKAAKPGDRITVAAGKYDCSNTYVDGSTGAAQGTMDHPIWIRGDAGAVVDCGDPVNGTGTALMLVGVHYIVVEGIEFTNAGGHILHVYGSSNGVLFKNVHAHRAGLACLKASQSDGVSVEDSELSDAGLAGDPSKATSGQIIDYVGVHNSLVARSKIHGAVGNGMGSPANIAVQFKGGSHDIILAQNEIYAANTAVNLGGSTGAQFFDPQDADYEGQNVVAYANVVTGPMDVAFSAIGCHQCAVYNNTVVAPIGSQALRMLPGATPQGGTSHTIGFTVENNLFSFVGNGPQDLFNATPDDQAGVVQQANLFFASGKPASSIYSDVPVVGAPGNILDMDPVLVSPPADVHLGKGSPAIGAGVPVPMYTGDHAGVCRKAWDIGAFAAQ
jgi:hypothetical protein